jgi:hypothetical protein
MLHEVVQYFWVIVDVLEDFLGLVAHEYLEQLAEIPSEGWVQVLF